MTSQAASFRVQEPTPSRRRFLPEWRPVAWVVGIAFITAVLLLPLTKNTFIEILGETLFVGIVLLGAFTAAGAWRQTLIPRSMAQVIAIALAAPFGPLVVQLLATRGDFSAFLRSPSHVRGYVLVTFAAAVLGTIVGIGALFRERDARLKSQALQFELERETLHRQAADAQLRLMTAQVQPHFLLNTLANVQELVESGSPRAVPVFRSLIDYLRAAMPGLQKESSTLGDEERLVRAYLELMHMRMPDRLAFSVDIDPALRSRRFPPMALLTLVENAIHHGVDPSEDAARVDVWAARTPDGGAHLRVRDTGVGMSETAGVGTGLSNLEARLKAAFGPRVILELSEEAPHGVRAEIRLPPNGDERA